jgi:NitT/TauT family transport system substrate-binding protein
VTRAQALALVSGAALAPLASLAPASAQATPLRIGVPASDSFAIGFFAVDQGFFRRAGFDAAITPFRGSGPVSAAIAGGALDIGLTDVIQIANAASRGIPFAAIAGGGLYSAQESNTELCVPKTSSYRSPKDLEGQTVAVITVASLMAAAVKAWLAQHGADPEKVRLVEMPPAEMVPALERGTVSAAYLAEPVLSQVRERVRPVASPYDAIGNGFLISTWFSTREWLTKNPDVARRVVAAIYEASRWANDHRDLTAPILAKYAKLDIENARAMRRARYATSLQPQMLQPVLDVAAKYKIIARDVPAGTLIAKI